MERILGASVAIALLSLTAASSPAVAQDEKFYTLTIKDHKFEPSQIEVPADTKVKLVIKNLDSSPEEFEMSNPKREKVVKGGQEGTIYVGPFRPGTYEFVGEFNPKTARGQIVVK
jgi:plastocyanin